MAQPANSSDPTSGSSSKSSDVDVSDGVKVETTSRDDFASQAQTPTRNVVIELGSEFLQFLKEEKKWWLIPIIVSLGLIALIALLLHSPAAPFIYPLF